jgi:hypothetical protein
MVRYPKKFFVNCYNFDPKGVKHASIPIEKYQSENAIFEVSYKILQIRGLEPELEPGPQF